MIWVSEGYCREDLLSPLGLYSIGGSALNGKMSYIIYSKSKNDNFRYEVEFNKIDKNIKKIEIAYIMHLRKEKLIKLTN